MNEGCMFHRGDPREHCGLCRLAELGGPELGDRETEIRNGIEARAVAEERARVVAWLRDRPTDRDLADRDNELIEWTRKQLALAIERGEHDDASAGGAQEPRSGGTRGRP